MSHLPGSSALRRVVVAGLAVTLTGGLLAVVPAGAAGTSADTAAVTAAAPSSVVQVFSRSGRGDLITGGNALIEVVLPTGASADGLRVDVDGRDVTSAFRLGEGPLLGLVSELPQGASTVSATLPDGRGARLALRNAPIGGPVFSGPQIQPWACTTGAEDEQCNRPATIEYRYKSTNQTRSGLQAYNPDSPPSDVAKTKTDQGNEVPFIVRVETGVSVRDQYRIAALHDPAQPVDPTQRYEGNNGKLVLTHGASCDTSYRMGSAPDVLLEDALSRGFAVASHALDNAGHNCNIVTQAESLVVTKELVAERFGPIRYTIGTGCSGGALAQQQVANAYPGVYQGILPQCSFTDAWSSAQQYIDYVALRNYLEGPGALESGILPEQYNAVYGHPNPANAITFTTAIPNSGEPSRNCPGVPRADVYDEKTNPDGVRCTLQDYMVNVFGVVDDGTMARRPLGNTGIQYGLSGLLGTTQPQLLPRQFVALNKGIGGFDMDLNKTVERTPADLIALERSYRTGAVNTGKHLDKVAIIDLRGPDPGAFHDVYRTNSMTDRLVREHGTSENQALWEGPVALLGSTAFVTQGIRAMDTWLAVVEADDRDVPLPQKILEARDTAEVRDRCTDASGVDRPGMTSCPEVDTQVFASPRIEAGGGAKAVGYTDDRLECDLVPLEEFDYNGMTFEQRFTEAERKTLREVFPTGVCDYTTKGQGFTDTVPWMTYQDDKGGVVYGGRALGPEPVSVPFGPAVVPGTGPCDGAPVAPVTDRAAARGEHRLSIDCVMHVRIALGTTTSTYSPTRPVTREQMAKFLLTTLESSGVTVPAAQGPDRFGDISRSHHREAINRMAAINVARGDGGAFSPAASLTREQMASFLVRTAEFAAGRALPAQRTDHFGDVPAGSVHERQISAGFEGGLFSGTVAPVPGQPRSGSFDPGTVVLRDQMATFLVRLYTRTAKR